MYVLRLTDGGYPTMMMGIYTHPYTRTDKHMHTRITDLRKMLASFYSTKLRKTSVPK